MDTLEVSSSAVDGVVEAVSSGNWTKALVWVGVLVVGAGLVFLGKKLGYSIKKG